jgi:hypothetical protein
LIWTSAVGCWLVTKADVRKALLGVVKAVFHPKLLAALAALMLWCGALVWFARTVGLWTRSLAAATALWLAGALLVVGIFGAQRVSKETRWACKAMLGAVGMSALVAGLEGLYVFPLLGELVFVPTVTALVGTRVVAGTRNAYASVAKLLDVVLALVAVGVLVFIGIRLATDLIGARFGTAEGVQCAPPCTSWLQSIPAHRASLGDDWRSVAMPIWLTAGLLPLVYVIGALTAYEYAFLLIDFCDPDRDHTNRAARRRAKLGLVVGVNVRVRWLGEFRPPWPYRLFTATSVGAAIGVARAFQRTPIKELHKEERHEK